MRSAVLAARREMSARALADSAARMHAVLRERLAGLLPPRATATPVVTAYVPAGPEPGGPDLPDVLCDLLPPAARLLLPVLCEDLDLDWAEYEGTLVPARMGLREPPGARLGPAAVAGASLMLVPAVAVDRRGVRLGRGGGSFDRALARTTPATRVVALLHDGELRDGELPAQPHDRRVDAVITPAGGLVPVSGRPVRW